MLAAALSIPDRAVAAPAGDAGGAVEDVEDVEALEVKGAPPTAAAGRPTGLGLVGRLHPLLVHLPIAWLLLLLLVDGATFLLGRPWQRAGRLLLVACVASLIPAVSTGLLLANAAAPTAADELARLLLHRNLALTLAGVCVAALALRLVRPEPLAGARRALYLLLLLAAAALVGAVGHLGGAMVFGPDYLPF